MSSSSSECENLRSAYCVWESSEEEDSIGDDEAAELLTKWDTSQCTEKTGRYITQCDKEDELVEFIFGDVRNLFSQSDYEMLVEKLNNFSSSSEEFEKDSRRFIQESWNAFIGVYELLVRNGINIHEAGKISNMLYDEYARIFTGLFPQIVQGRTGEKELTLRTSLEKKIRSISDSVPCLSGKRFGNPWGVDGAEYQPVSPLQLAWDTWHLAEIVDERDGGKSERQNVFVGIPQVCGTGTMIHLFVRFGNLLNDAIRSQEGGARRRRRKSSRRRRRKSSRRRRRKSSRRRRRKSSRRRRRKSSRRRSKKRY